MKACFRFFPVILYFVLVSLSQAELLYYKDALDKHDFSRKVPLDPKILATKKAVTFVRGYYEAQTSQGPRKLFCEVYVPAGGVAPSGVLYFLHGLKASANYVRSPVNGRTFAEQVTGDQGLAIVACDHWGHGFSEGARESIPSFDELSREWMKLVGHFNSFLAEQYQMRERLPWALSGHSMGGALVLNFLRLLSHAEGDAENELLLKWGKPQGALLYSPAIGQDGLKGLLDFVTAHLPQGLRRGSGTLAGWLGLNLPFFFNLRKFSRDQARNEDIVVGGDLYNVGFLAKLLRRSGLNIATAGEIAAASRAFKEDLSYSRLAPIALIYGSADTWVGPQAAAKYFSSLQLAPSPVIPHCELVLTGARHDSIIESGAGNFAQEFLAKVFAKD
jgi:alpha-beta hydrolase superfamily lysophospholipase